MGLITEIMKITLDPVLGPEWTNFIFGKGTINANISDSGDEPNPVRSHDLEEVKRKAGSIDLWIGNRETGKTVGAQRLAEFFDRDTYCYSPEQKLPSWIKPVELHKIEKLPRHITLIMEDLPVVMGSKDWNNEFVIAMERIIPVVRHERRQWHLIFNTQSSIQADKYILGCDLAFLKPWGILAADMERPNIRQVYKHLVMPYFESHPGTDFKRRHAFMVSENYKGGILITKPPANKGQILLTQQNSQGVYEVTGQEQGDIKDED